MARKDRLTQEHDPDEFVRRWWEFIPEGFKQQFNDELFAIVEEQYGAGHYLGQEAGLELAQDTIAEAKASFWEDDE